MYTGYQSYLKKVFKNKENKERTLSLCVSFLSLSVVCFLKNMWEGKVQSTYCQLTVTVPSFVHVPFLRPASHEASPCHRRLSKAPDACGGP